MKLLNTYISEKLVLNKDIKQEHDDYLDLILNAIYCMREIKKDDPESSIDDFNKVKRILKDWISDTTNRIYVYVSDFDKALYNRLREKYIDNKEKVVINMIDELELDKSLKYASQSCVYKSSSAIKKIELSQYFLAIYGKVNGRILLEKSKR